MVGNSVPCLKLKILQSEKESCDSDTSFQTTDAELTFQGIIGHHKYTPEIRKSLHNFLADQAPVSKIAYYLNSIKMLQSYKCRTKIA